MELCNSTPKYLCCSTDCKSMLLIEYVAKDGDKDRVQLRATHLAGFNVICHCLVHSTKVFKSCCK